MEGHWGRKGGPWELNLRDVFRWCDLLIKYQVYFCKFSFCDLIIVGYVVGNIVCIVISKGLLLNSLLPRIVALGTLVGLYILFTVTE